ncbi:sigma-70 family RNA polymerase sigma factor [Verticiella sediminum]|uniref:Sigma-70 family RNA polymerase sigma factor n=1 Tax=Verticiella sediminum TaxID=1247510 RepID=A0A556B1G9_9BURK|nr:sigma-70 family RNA polymerase sigma factor [Verticiella sediminum]TSH99037.1 sigma-70 family RNA polymerase sigma factor [Verticiella sediminum]
MPEPHADAGDFAALRPGLLRLAYRMLGSWAEAEDVVQDAYLRWHGADHAAVRNAQAFLRQTVTRLCLDLMKSAGRQRQTYIGPWVPEPVLEEHPGMGEGDALTLALMMALERLSPLERAAFLLHDVFGLPFEEVAATLARDAAACRQLAARARGHVQKSRPRYPVSAERGRQIAQAFFAASRRGDMAGLQALLAADVQVHTDGGGKRPAALVPLYGADKAARFFVSLARKGLVSTAPVVRETVIDGLPGFITRELDGVLQTTALWIEQDRIQGIYIVRNPDKLRGLPNFDDPPNATLSV